ncbi:MAG: hypothetical protein ABUT20_19590 [Bacteroidota bacterium]
MAKDWIANEKEKLIQEKKEAEEKAIKEKKIKDSLEGNQIIGKFILDIENYLGEAASVGVHLSTHVTRKKIYFFKPWILEKLSVSRDIPSVKLTAAREIELNFSHDDNGYWASVFEGIVSIHNSYPINEQEVFQRDEKGNYRRVIECDWTSAGMMKLENTVNNGKKIFIDLNQLNENLVKEMITWVAKKSDSLTLPGKSFTSNLKSNVSFWHSIDSMVISGIWGAAIGVVIGFAKGCSKYHVESSPLSQPFWYIPEMSLLFGIIGVFVGLFRGKVR